MSTYKWSLGALVDAVELETIATVDPYIEARVYWRYGIHFLRVHMLCEAKDGMPDGDA